MGRKTKYAPEVRERAVRWALESEKRANEVPRKASAYFPQAELDRRPKDLDAVAAAHDGRPRKSLDWKTPAEALGDHPSSIEQPGVATTR